MMENDRKFSDDGYIIDQDLFTDFPYRTSTSNYNGCGWIAAYNLRHAKGQDVCYDDVRKELDEMHTERVPGPTLMRVLRAYLKKYVPDYVETIGKNEATEAAAHSYAGIFRYTEGEVPHFITFVRVDPERPLFRFFNVNDDIIDTVIDMYEFCGQHFIKNSVIAMTVASAPDKVVGNGRL